MPYFEHELPLSEATRKGSDGGSPSNLPMHEIPLDIELHERKIVDWLEQRWPPRRRFKCSPATFWR